MQVGGAPTQKVTKSQLTIMCKLGNGAQHREFQKNSTDNASWRGPNTEGDEKSAYNNVQVGERGPNIENFKRNSTDNASWEQRNKFYENIISIPLLRITT